MSVCLSICLSVSFCVYICLSVCESMCFCLCLSVTLSVYICVYESVLYLCTHVCVYLFVTLCTLCMCLGCVCVCVCVCVCTRCYRSEDNLSELIFSFHLWIPGVELRTSVLAASTFAHRAIRLALKDLILFSSVSYYKVFHQNDKMLSV